MRRQKIGMRRQHIFVNKGIKNTSSYVGFIPVSLYDLQYGQRYYASTIFRDLQNVFHDVISGDLWSMGGF